MRNIDNIFYLVLHKSHIELGNGTVSEKILKSNHPTHFAKVGHMSLFKIALLPYVHSCP